MECKSSSFMVSFLAVTVGTSNTFCSCSSAAVSLELVEVMLLLFDGIVSAVCVEVLLLSFDDIIAAVCV